VPGQGAENIQLIPLAFVTDRIITPVVTGTRNGNVNEVSHRMSEFREISLLK
jgi:hypothetical protein